MLYNLQKVKDLTGDLHVRYTVKRAHKEGSEEDKLQQLDDDYVTQIEYNYPAIGV